LKEKELSMFDYDHQSQGAEGFPLRLFFLLFTPVALLILGGAWYVGKERIEEEMSLVRASEISNVVIGVRRLDDELHTPLRQLRTLSGEGAVRRAVETGAPADLQAMEQAFAKLIAYTESYAKIRWVDAAGQERVRVNSVGGQPEPVSGEALQLVTESYYFKEGLRLKPGEVYLSPLDLNVENGKIESPYKPMLRLAMPMHGADGSARGLLVLNVAASRILDAFTDNLMEARDHAMLLNSEGYWLVHPDSDDEWGFMLDHKKTLGGRNAAAWKAISAIPSGQEELADGIWTWSTVYPLKADDSRAAKGIPFWYVVSHLSDEQLAPMRQSAWRTVGIYMLGLLVLYGLIAAWLARAVVGRAAAVAEASKAHAEAEAANRIRQAQERFRLVVEANTNGLLVTDKNGRIVLANPALTRMFGYSADELLGQSIEILLPESARPVHSRLYAGFMAAPEARPMGSGRELFGRRKSGEIFPIEISLSPFDENGETYVDAFVADISERKRSELLHRRIEARLQLMMQTNPNGLLVVDDQGAIEMANPALEQMFGYGPGELFNQPLERLIPKANQGRHVQLRQNYLRDPSIRSMGPGLDLHGARKDGTAFPIQVSLASFTEDGRVYVQATVIDARRES
jgi:PAS domain S-box-containing protein